MALRKKINWENDVMAVVQLNPTTFVEVPAGLWQAQSGMATFSDTATPAEGDTQTLAAGEFIVTQTAKYARGVGKIVVLTP